MTVTLHLEPEVEAGLRAQAESSGMVLKDYVLTLVEEAALPASSRMVFAEREDRAKAVRRMLEFGDTHQLSLGEPVSRALLHEGHRF